MGCRDVPDACEQDVHQSAREQSLIDDPIDPLRLAGSGGAGDQDGHARGQRGDEDDDDEKDLPGDSDRGVAGEADVVAHHHVIHDALQAGHDVLEECRPGQLPDGRAQRTLHQRAVEGRLVPGHRSLWTGLLDARLEVAARHHLVTSNRWTFEAPTPGAKTWIMYSPVGAFGSTSMSS